MPPEETTEQLLDAVQQAWKRSDDLFAIVRPAALLERPVPLRNPLVFYVGHLPAFCWNMLGKSVLERGSDQPDLDRLFDFGIDPEDESGVPEEPDWPALDAVHAYRDHVRGRILACAPEIEERAPDHVLARHGRILHLMLEHELMHHETLLYLLQELPPESKVRPAHWPETVTGDARVGARVLRVEGGPVALGADFDGQPFGWDNEFPQRTRRVAPFSIDSTPVTVAQFRDFVDAGGYEAAEHWDPRAFAWVRERGLRRPKDWCEVEGRPALRALFEVLPLDDVGGWPASVSWSEADAYARWKGGRLPREEELFLLTYTDPEGGQRTWPWGEAAPAAEHGNFDFHHGAPTPVGSHPAGDGAFGVTDVLGNGWEWTGTVFAEHPGFTPWVECYAGYSRDFFDGAHYVVHGASWATDRRLLRRSFRNWYRYNYPYPFTKFRVAYDD